MHLSKMETLQDVDLVKSFFHDIFPEESSYDCAEFRNSVTGEHPYSMLEYYFAKNDDGTIVGFCGLYSSKTDPDEVWIGWFGIKLEFRRRGYGSEMLSELERMSKERGFEYCRLYTDKKINHNAYSLYLKFGYIEDSQYEYDFVTMVKSLSGGEVPAERIWSRGEPIGFESEIPTTFSDMTA